MSEEDIRGKRSGRVWQRLLWIGRRRKSHVKRVLVKTAVPNTFDAGAPI
jgi:hypothetical protein